ncbi:transposase [Streptococcus dysgalactiae subsp. equisimilis]|nr:transposase [Streptococcus dysgalactiae subsp. equisimilis]
MSCKKLTFIQLPPCSPDLNVIENFFSYLKKRIGFVSSRTDLDSEFRRAISHEDNKFIIRNLVNSMPIRLQAVIKNRGSYTNF